MYFFKSKPDPIPKFMLKPNPNRDPKKIIADPNNTAI